MSTQGNDPIPPIGDIKLTEDEQRQLEELDNMLDLSHVEVYQRLDETEVGRGTHAYLEFHKRLLTDSTFEDAYGLGVSYTTMRWKEANPVAFIYKGALFFRDRRGHWEMETGEDLVTWLLEHPPMPTLQPIADLYMHSKGVERGSPWLLFQYIAGIAETEQSWQLTKLLPVGVNDAYYLGKALGVWGINSSEAHPYVELLLEYTELAS